MRNDIVGGLLILTSALLYISRYIVAALFIGSTQSWSKELFQTSYKYVGNDLTLWSMIALVAGLITLVKGYATKSTKHSHAQSCKDQIDNLNDKLKAEMK